MQLISGLVQAFLACRAICGSRKTPHSTVIHDACPLNGEGSLVPVLVLSSSALLSAYNINLAFYSPCAYDNDLAPVCCKVPLRQLGLCGSFSHVMSLP